MSKPLAEVLTGVYVNELHKRNPQAFPHWENTSDEHRRAHLSAMHSVVQVLDLFNLTVRIDEHGNVQAEKRVPEKSKSRTVIVPGTQSPTDLGAARMTYSQSRQMGFEGDACPECGAMMMVRNGSCLKCQSCGSTTGCS